MSNANKSLDLTFDLVAAINKKRCDVWHPAGLKEWNDLEWSGAMCGEAGEAANVAKKLKRLEEGHAGRNRGSSWKTMSEPDLTMKYMKEIGDTYLYLDLMAQRRGLRIVDCIRLAFNMTSEKEGLPQRLP